MCHKLVEHSRRAQRDLTGRPEGWVKIYDSLVDGPFLRPKQAAPAAIEDEKPGIQDNDNNAGTTPAGSDAPGRQPASPAAGGEVDTSSPKPLSLVALTEQQEFESYPRESREVAYARLEIIKVWIEEKQRAKADKIRIGTLEKAFIRQLLEGKICLKAAQVLAKAGELKISIRSIYRWEQAWRGHEGLYPIALVDKWHPNRSSKEQQYARTFVKMQAAGRRDLRVPDIMRLAVARVPGFDMSYRTVARIVQETRNDRLLMAATSGPTAYKNEARPHIRRINDCQPGDKSEADGKMVNVLVMSPFWFHNDKSMRYLIRPVVVAWLDVATWYITGWATWMSESWHLVRTSFIDAMGKAGVPRIVTYDGGGAFFNIYTDPQEFAGRKRETATVKKARELLSRGYTGFYEQFGVEHKVRTIPGNSESKQIEPAWGDIFGEWEKQQFAYVGKDISARPEWARMTNLAFLKKFKEKILTWDEYVRSIGDFINEWNNRPRPGLKRLDGSIASPAEAFNEFADRIRKPAREIVEHACWHPRKVLVQRDGVYLDGLLYRHPAFGVYLGQSMLAEYDERNRFECRIATTSGEVLATPARLVIPGMHMDAEQSKLAMIDRAHYEKELRAVYLARANHGDSMTIAEMNSLTANVDLLLQDQSRRQEKDKALTMIPDGHVSNKRPPAKQIESEFTSIEDEFAECVPTAAQAPEPDADDELLNEISKDLNNIGLRSIK
jgi:transposase